MENKNKMKTKIETLIFGSKWMLIPFYIGLIFAQFIYLYWYGKDIVGLFSEAGVMTKQEGMLIILELVDIVMIANLIKMIIAGSYHSFISKEHNETNEKSSSGLLKVKMATSLIGVSSIHLLQSFINAKQLDWDTIHKQILIHGMFLVGAIALAIIEFLHVKGEVLENESEHKCKNEITKH